MPASSKGCIAAGLPAASIQLVPTTDRAAVGYLLSSMTDYIDVVVPRGGKSLVARVQQEARVPVIGHLEGVCHVYVDRDADLAMARAIVKNAKLRRTGVCGSAETLLVDAACAATHLAPVVKDLLDAGCEVRGDAAVQKVDARVKPATEQDWYTEYLDAIIAARVVDGVDAAIEHIGKYGSAHTESIVTANAATAQRFLERVDSAIVLHNASTQFADGGEFGMGAEIGISTDRFHARGPVGVEQLTSYKYVVRAAARSARNGDFDLLAKGTGWAAERQRVKDSFGATGALDNRMEALYCVLSGLTALNAAEAARMNGGEGRLFRSGVTRVLARSPRAAPPRCRAGACLHALSATRASIRFGNELTLVRGFFQLDALGEMDAVALYTRGASHLLARMSPSAILSQLRDLGQRRPCSRK